MVSDASPDWKRNEGAINVIERQGDASHEVKLIAAPGSELTTHEPKINYLVIVCGKGKFSGFIILEQEARLINPVMSPEISPVKGAWSVGLGNTSDIIGSAGPDSNTAQAFKVDIPDVAPCIDSSNQTPQPTDPWLGTPLELSGKTSTQVGYVGRYAGFDGPKEVESWPLIGAFSAPSTSVTGVFQGAGKLSGSYARPPRFLSQVNANIPMSLHVESAEPQPATTAGLTWQSFSAIAPIAEMTNEDVATRWQDATATAGICFGIGAAIFSTEFLGWLRKKRDENDQAASRENPLEEPTSLQSTAAEESIAQTGDRSAVYRAAVAIGIGAFLWGILRGRAKE
ncbi:hypothetical protein ACFY1U_15120 [Streptomyces sp. NPDC001351]|uniref:hypothetical protein n=1 Tax=Streptomyces sp. NPDC001351 TaxID=3364564 RepID=UPI0036919DC3